MRNYKLVLNDPPPLETSKEICPAERYLISELYRLGHETHGQLRNRTRILPVETRYVKRS